MTEELVLTVRNRHIADCGIPPSLNAGEVFFCSYFENDYAEQLVIVLKDTGAWLYHGDIGWETPIEIVNGCLARDFVLSDEEREWLALCWKQIEKRQDYLRRKQRSEGEH